MNPIHQGSSHQQDTQEKHQYRGESSQPNNQDTQQQKLPEFFVYPKGIIEEGVTACARSIIGKIITNKFIHVSSIQNGLESIWGSPPGLKVQEIEGKLLQFCMDRVEDQDRILQGNPWIFRNSWLIVKPWDRETNPQTLDFDHVPIWIQLWGLPTHCKTKLMGASLGALMGTVEASEFYEYPGKKVIIKIKVNINVYKPITSGIHVGNPNDGNCWVDYRYEKLPLVCFKCGLVGHADTLCRNPPMILGTLAPLGTWIRSTRYGKRKMEAKDRKFYSNPSQAPNFGQYSSPVPTALPEQLAAMKINTPRGDEPQQNSHYNTNQSQQTKGNSSTQHKTIHLKESRQKMQIEEAMQTSEAMNSNMVKQITPAKRQKMETENE
jgi:hypothetical protein